MTKNRALRKLRAAHWRGLERYVRQAYEAGYEAGVARARGMARRGRTIRADATVEGLTRLIERHFGLDRYGFEVRIVHAGSKKRVPARDVLQKYRLAE